ncbi:MAG: phage terminase small subunit P27 family [Mycobacterium sp.]|nr:phage terminase small subunit P27 family [Mycobacterium sp.]
MGRRGPTPRPNHLKAIEGVREHRLNRDEPVPERGAVVPPVDLEPEAQAVWDRLAPELIAKRVLTSWDVDAFASYCRWTAMYNEAAEAVKRSGLMVMGSQGQQVLAPAVRAMEIADKAARSTGQRFGLTPGDRAQLKVNDTGIKVWSGAPPRLSCPPPLRRGRFQRGPSVAGAGGAANNAGSARVTVGGTSPIRGR